MPCSPPVAVSQPLCAPRCFVPSSLPQLPDYIQKQSELKAAGVHEVIVFAVNDPHVMAAWARDQGIESTMIRFLADPEAKLTTALGMLLDDQRVLQNNLGNPRCKRFALIVEDGTIRAVKVSGTSDDPAGDDDPSETNVESMLACIPRDQEPGGAAAGAVQTSAPGCSSSPVDAPVVVPITSGAAPVGPPRFFIQSQEETCLDPTMMPSQGESCLMDA